MTTANDGAADLRAIATDIAGMLSRRGHIAWFAGGCVRDRLLGEKPKDYDIATDATPDDIRAVLPGAHRVGEAFGVMLVRREGIQTEIATFRRDGAYHDGRRPESVTFSGPEEDAARRDFTINGLFEDPVDGRVIDFVGGVEDLRTGVIRAIGDPVERLREDHLRALRAVRFVARFDFALDPATADAIRAEASHLAGVSRERIGHELRMMEEGLRFDQAAEMLSKLGLADAVFSERLVAGRRLRKLSARRPGDHGFGASLAAWQLDTEEDLGRSLGVNWRDALVLSNDECYQMESILKSHRRLLDEWSALSVAGRKRLVAHPSSAAACSIVEAGDPEVGGKIRADIAVLEGTPSGISPRPLVGGHDLIAAGIEPGPAMGAILETIRDAQLEDEIASGDDALALARRLMADSS